MLESQQRVKFSVQHVPAILTDTSYPPLLCIAGVNDSAEATPQGVTTEDWIFTVSWGTDVRLKSTDLVRLSPRRRREEGSEGRLFHSIRWLGRSTGGVNHGDFYMGLYISKTILMLWEKKR